MAISISIQIHFSKKFIEKHLLIETVQTVSRM